MIGVVADAARHLVSTLAAVQIVIARPADQHVVPRQAEQGIVTRAAVDVVTAGCPEQGVRPVVTGQQITDQLGRG
ncbi:hypothetical protein D3C76_1322790 [compost metagenome]